MCETCERVAEALHAAEHEEAEHVEEITDASVRIAEIEASKEITLAKIHAGLEKTAIVAETDADLVEAETKAEVLADVVETLSPEPEPAPAAAPVMVVNDDQAEPEATDPPKAEEHDRPEEPKPETKKRGFF